MNSPPAERPPHPATVQKKAAPPGRKSRPPHPAAAIQEKADGAPKAARSRAPHPATVAQTKSAPPGQKKARPPHPATVAQKKEAPGPKKSSRPPHPATVSRSAPGAAQKAGAAPTTALRLEDKRSRQYADPIAIQTYQGWARELRNPKPGARAIQLQRGWHTAFEQWAGTEIGHYDLRFDKDSVTHRAYFVKNQWWILDEAGHPHAWT